MNPGTRPKAAVLYAALIPAAHTSIGTATYLGVRLRGADAGGVCQGTDRASNRGCLPHATTISAALFATGAIVPATDEQLDS